jgi:TRAP-type C4-dicarboxylate transport system permease small subunit
VRILNAISNGLARIEAVALAICLLTMLGVAFFQVVMRNLYDVGYVWADILVRLLVLWVGLLGASLATHEGSHLTIDVVTKFLPQRVTTGIRVVVRIFALIICAILARAAYQYILLQRDTSTGGVLFGIPDWVMEVIIPVAFALIAFHFVILILQGIYELITHRKVFTEQSGV